MRGADIGTPRQLVGLAVAHAYEQYPAEACGVLAGPAGGRGDGSDHIFFLDNVAPDDGRHFRVSAAQQLGVWEVMDRRRLDPTVVYHSHPRGGCVPSGDDVERHDRTTLMMIISLADLARPEIAIYEVTADGEAIPVPWPQVGVYQVGESAAPARGDDRQQQHPVDASADPWISSG